MNKKEVIRLLEKYQLNTCTQEEKSAIESWYNMQVNKNSDTPLNDDLELAKSLIWNNLEKLLPVIRPKSFRLRLITAAAAVLLVIGAGFFFYISSRHPEFISGSPTYTNDIKPGSNKAYLILSNGKRLSLNDAANGSIAKDADVEITKTADGQVIYAPHHPGAGRDPGKEGVTYSNALNTIETPRGGHYQIRLPDGSKVWLNAASKLIYPVSFNGRGQRVVELSGEAYFEIFKNKLQPFVVKSKNQEVTVLGTHFNINSYSDEPGTKTTLLEGSVAIRHLEGSAAILNQVQHRLGDLSYRRDDARDRDGVVLKPGEQSILNGYNRIIVQKADIEQTMDWKDGLFVFNKLSLTQIMQKVARWYDIEVIFDKDVDTKQAFWGKVSRSKNLAEVLESIQSTGNVKFKVINRIVTVSKQE